MDEDPGPEKYPQPVWDEEFEAKIQAELEYRDARAKAGRHCAWCDDLLELNDDLLCAACSYKQAFLED